VRFLDDPHTLEKSNTLCTTSDKQSVRRLAIVRRDHYYKVQCKQDVDIGVLDTKTTKALQGLDEIGSVTYEAVVDAGDFDQHIKAWKNKGKAADWNLEINICGPQAARDKVGKLLSAARLYLQQPRCLTGVVSVDNPHMITFPNLTVESKLARLPTLLLSPECSPATSTRDLSEVFEGLDQNECLELIDVDSRITTTLLKYANHHVSLESYYSLFLLRLVISVKVCASCCEGKLPYHYLLFRCGRISGPESLITCTSSFSMQ
jgi:hypothetical protein